MKTLALPELLFISGKGGTGKTTLAASLAKLCSERGEKVLLVSTDPAHNLADLFCLSNSKQDRHLINERLIIQELKPEDELESYLSQAQQSISPFLGADSQAMLRRYLDFVRQSPGSGESAIFHRLAQLMQQQGRGEWQRLICDTAPSGHTLQLLNLPAQLGEWGQLLQHQQQKKDKLERFLLEKNNPVKAANSTTVADQLQRRQLLYQEFRQRLIDQQHCGVILVLEAQGLAIAETIRTAAALQQQQIEPYSICINRLLPTSNISEESDFYSQRRQLEQQYLQQITTQFSRYPLWHLALQSSDINHTNLHQLTSALNEQLVWNN